MPKINVPYLLESGEVYDITARLEIAAGTEIQAEENAGIGVYSGGIFNAVGEAGNPIIIKGKSDTQGFWRGIHIDTNSPDNKITYANISNGGSNYIYCCNPKANVYVKSGQMTVENSNLNSSGGCGLAANASATLISNSNTFSGNADGELCQ